MTEKRVVVITGGGSGIGRATAEWFAHEQQQVVIVGRTEEKLRRVAAEIGPEVSWQVGDVSQRAQVQALTMSIIDQFGKVDILVNNAGFILGTATTQPLSEAEAAWDAVLDANLKGSFLMAVALAPHLPRPGGRIINISSIAAYSGGSGGGASAYAAAKAGIIGLTHGLARELSAQGITVNAIAPGFIANTEFTGDWSETRIRQIVSQVPVGRGGRAEDIAAAVAYLASPEASFVTGEVLHVNGGWIFGQ